MDAKSGAELRKKETRDKTESFLFSFRETVVSQLFPFLKKILNPRLAVRVQPVRVRQRRLPQVLRGREEQEEGK